MDTIDGKRAESVSGVSQDTVTRVKRVVRKHTFAILALSGVVLGYVLGYSLKLSDFFGPEWWTDRRISYVRLPGDIFTSLIACLTIPILLSSIVAAIGSMDMQRFQFAIWRIFAYIFATTLFGSVLGAVLSEAIHPGDPQDRPIPEICYASYQSFKGDVIAATCTRDNHPCYELDYKGLWAPKNYNIKDKRLMNPFRRTCGETFQVINCNLLIDIGMDFFRIFFPDNIVEALILSRDTVPDLHSPYNVSKQNHRTCHGYTLRDVGNDRDSTLLTEFFTHKVTIDGMNSHGLMSFAIFLALAANYIGPVGRPLLNIFTSLSECSLMLGQWIMWLSPICISSKIAAKILEGDNIFEYSTSLHYYMLTSLAGVLIHTFFVLPLLYLLYVRKSPFVFYKQLLPVMAVSFGTFTSNGTTPLVIQVLEDICELDPRIVRLMCPIASHINVDGSGIISITGVLYVLQLHGIELSTSRWMELVFMNFVIVTTSAIHKLRFFRRMSIILPLANLPVSFSEYIHPVEWFMLPFVVVSNVLTDCVGTAIVCHLCNKQLEILDMEEALRSNFQWVQEDSEASSIVSKDKDAPKGTTGLDVDEIGIPSKEGSRLDTSLAPPDKKKQVSKKKKKGKFPRKKISTISKSSAKSGESLKTKASGSVQSGKSVRSTQRKRSSGPRARQKQKQPRLLLRKKGKKVTQVKSNSPSASTSKRKAVRKNKIRPVKSSLRSGTIRIKLITPTGPGDSSTTKKVSSDSSLR